MWQKRISTLSGTLNKNANVHHLRVTYISENECSIYYKWENDTKACKPIVASNSLTNRMYALKIIKLPNYNLSFRITDRAQKCLCNDTTIHKGYLIILNVYDDDIFLKIVENNSVKLTVSATGVQPFAYSFVTFNPNSYGNVSFNICSTFE